MTEQVNQQDEFLNAFGAALNNSADSSQKQQNADAGHIHGDDDGSTQPLQSDAPTDDPATAVGQQQDGQQDDPWAVVPEPLRQQFQSLQQNYNQLEQNHRANSGRVAALNRKTEELAAKLAAKEAAQGGPDANKDMPTAADLQGKSFEEIEQDWPEVAALMKHQLQQQSQTFQQQLQQQLAPLSEMQQAYQEQQQLHQQQAELQRLQQQHPDAQQIAADPTFHQWAATQPDSVQRLYASTSADDNAVLLTLFKASTGRLSAAPSQNKQPDLADHATIPKKGAGHPVSAKVPEDGDFLSLFDHHLSNSRK